MRKMPQTTSPKWKGPISHLIHLFKTPTDPASIIRMMSQDRALKPTWWTRARLRDVGVGNQLVEFDEFERYRRREQQGLLQPETLKPRTAKEIWAEWFTDYRSLVLIMHAFPYCAKLATLALRELASHQQRLHLSSVALLGGIGVILQVLDNHPFDVTLIETGVTCLARLSTFDSNRDAIARCDGAAVVASIMYEFPYSLSIQQWATYVLLSLTCAQCRGHKVVDSLISSQALHKVVHNMRVYPGANDLQKWSAMLLSTAIDEVDEIAREVMSTGSSSGVAGMGRPRKNSGVGFGPESIQHKFWSILMASLSISETRGPRVDTMDGISLLPSANGDIHHNHHHASSSSPPSGGSLISGTETSTTTVLTLHLLPLLYQLILHHLNNGGVLTSYMQLLMRLTGGKGCPAPLLRRAVAEYTTKTRLSLLTIIDKHGGVEEEKSNSNSYDPEEERRKGGGDHPNVPSSSSSSVSSLHRPSHQRLAVQYVDVLGDAKTMVAPCQFLSDAPVLLGLQTLKMPVLLAANEVTEADLSKYELRQRRLVLPVSSSPFMSPPPPSSSQPFAADASQSLPFEGSVSAIQGSVGGGGVGQEEGVRGEGGSIVQSGSLISGVINGANDITTDDASPFTADTPTKGGSDDANQTRPFTVANHDKDNQEGGDEEEEEDAAAAGSSFLGEDNSSSTYNNNAGVGGGGEEEPPTSGGEEPPSGGNSEIVIEVPLDPLSDTTVGGGAARLSTGGNNSNVVATNKRQSNDEQGGHHQQQPYPLSAFPAGNTSADHQQQHNSFDSSSPNHLFSASKLSLNSDATTTARYNAAVAAAVDVDGLGVLTSPSGSIVEMFANLLMRYGLQRLRPVQRQVLVQYLRAQRSKPEEDDEIGEGGDEATIKSSPSAVDQTQQQQGTPPLPTTSSSAALPPRERRPFVPQGVLSNGNTGQGHHHPTQPTQARKTSSFSSPTATVRPPSGQISSRYATGARSIVDGDSWGDLPLATTSGGDPTAVNNTTTSQAPLTKTSTHPTPTTTTTVTSSNLPREARKMSVFAAGAAGGGLNGTSAAAAAAAATAGRARGASIIHFPTMATGGNNNTNATAGNSNNVNGLASGTNARSHLILNSGAPTDTLGGFNASSSLSVAQQQPGGGGGGGAVGSPQGSMAATTTRQMIRDFMAERDALSAGEDDEVLATRGMSLCGPEQFGRMPVVAPSSSHHHRKGSLKGSGASSSSPLNLPRRRQK